MKMTPEELEGWKPFKFKVKKTRGKNNFNRNNTKRAHPWLYKSKPLMPEGVVLKPSPFARKEAAWRPGREEFRTIRGGKPGDPYVKPPLAERKQSPKSQMKILRFEERVKIATEWPREVEKFKSGDRIKVTKYVSLARDSKMEVVKGMVIGRTFRGLESYFRIINWKVNVMYEMNIPLWSPFIKTIEVIKHGTTKRKKLFYMKERPWKEYITK